MKYGGGILRYGDDDAEEDDDEDDVEDDEDDDAWESGYESDGQPPFDFGYGLAPPPSPRRTLPADS